MAEVCLVAEGKKHWLRNAFDWGRNIHWVWMLFPGDWRAAAIAFAVGAITWIFARISKVTPVEVWMLILVAVGIYFAVWLLVKNFGPSHKSKEPPSDRKEAKLPEHRPFVVPDEYGKDAKQNLHGLTVSNPGYAAFDVHILSVPLHLSGYTLVFPETLTKLGERDHRRFIAAWLEHPIKPGMDGSQLFNVMRIADIDSVHFSILYKDTEFRWYKSICIIERRPEVPGGLRVRVRGQELIPEPLVP